MNHTFSENLLSRLHKYAKPFESIEGVICRILDSLEEASPPQEQSSDPTDIPNYDPSKVPDLTWSKPLEISVEGKTIKPEWNVLLAHLIGIAASKKMNSEDIKSLLFIPSTIGDHDGPGYRYVKDANVSFQGQNTRKAWEQSAKIASAIGAKVHVIWEWYHNPKAIKPGAKGQMALNE